MGVRTGSAPGRVARAAVRALALVVCAAALTGWPGHAAAADDGWSWPMSGPPPVTRGFAPPELRYGSGHRGVDLGGAPGTPVLAAGGGEVAFAGLLAGRGVVVVRHGQLRTTYEPVTAQVVVGQPVARSEPIGTLDAGHPGCAVAACLHWGLKRGEEYLDPLSLVGAGPVRLLPSLGTGAAAAPLAGVPRVRPVEAREEPAATAPAFDLRSAASPSGLLALAALLAGLVLLARPRPPSAPGSAGQQPSDPPWDEPAGDALPAPVVDLELERVRRSAQR